MTSTLRPLLAALVASLGLVLVTPGPATACSCVGAGTEQFLEWADEVFAGTVVDVAIPPTGRVVSSLEPAIYTIEVDTVFEGDSAAITRVRSAISGASCGLESIDIGRRYVVFTSPPEDSREAGESWASVCGGTAPASSAYVAEVEAVTGPGRAPEPASDPPAPDPPALGALFVGVLGLVITFLESA